MAENLGFDHVILGVADLDAATTRLKEQYGFEFVGEGRHPGGTKNRAVRFATSYLEILAVDDPTAPNGEWLHRLVEDGDRLIGWAVRTDDIDAVSQRLAIPALPGSVTREDGTVGTWRVVGSPGRGDRPFFIQYDTASDPPDAADTDIAWVEVSGDVAKIGGWLGDATLDVRIQSGEPGLLAVGLSTPAGEIVLRGLTGE